MRKLKLAIETLAVESFRTGDEPPAAGTCPVLVGGAHGITRMAAPTGPGARLGSAEGSRCPPRSI